MEDLGQWLLNTFGPWAAVVVGMVWVIRWQREQIKKLGALLDKEREDHEEVKEQYSATLLEINQQMMMAVRVLTERR